MPSSFEYNYHTMIFKVRSLISALNLLDSKTAKTSVLQNQRQAICTLREWDMLTEAQELKLLVKIKAEFKQADPSSHKSRVAELKHLFGKKTPSSA